MKIRHDHCPVNEIFVNTLVYLTPDTIVTLLLAPLISFVTCSNLL